MNGSLRIVWLCVLCLIPRVALAQEKVAEHPVPESPLWLTYHGGGEPGAGRHIVLVAADQEYRSEQSMPMLARILSKHHGFDCTVLFSVNEKGEVDPTLPDRTRDKEMLHRIPGLEHLAEADLVIWLHRFMTLPDESLAHVYRYLDSGKPIIGIRTANHGFLGFEYQVDGRKIDFGDDILGGKFRGHHGRWHQDSTRGMKVEANQDHPVLIGVEDVWGPSDVYRTYPKDKGLPEGCTPLLMGQPLTGRQPTDPPNEELIALPVAWVKTWTSRTGNTARVFHTTMGSAKDFESAGLRRLVINAAYWCLEMEDKIRADASVEIIGDYEPLPSGFDYDRLGVKPHPPAYYR
ncbi:MAG: ThuA domain-containing protein [Planctomycetota bacterium]